MTTFLFLVAVVQIIWLLSLQDKTAGMSFRIRKLEQKIKEAENLSQEPQKNSQPADKPAEQIPELPPTPVMAAAVLPETEKNISAAKEQHPEEQTVPLATESNDAVHDAQILPPVLPAEHKTAAKQAPGLELSPAKLFSWIGGLMLFLGCVFGIKYAVENNLLSPAARIILSTGLGLVLAAAGAAIRRETYRITAHTLLGSGLAVIYASVYCAHAFYQFIPPGVTFILLALTAFAAFGAAIGKNAKYVGYLGAIIAFLTPLLLNSANDAWIALFTYILFINAAAALAAAKRGWNSLLVCTLALTWLSQGAWLFAQLPVKAYKLNGICIFFSLYTFGAAWMARRRLFQEPARTAVGVFLCAEMLLALPLGLMEMSAVNSVKLLGYTLFVNLLILWQTGQKNLPAPFAHTGKIIAFFTLFVWSNAHFNELSPVLLFGSFIVFAAVNGGAEFICKQKDSATTKPTVFSALYPALLMLPPACALAVRPDLPFGLTMLAMGLLFILMSGAVLMAFLAGATGAAAAGMGIAVLVLWSLTDRLTAWSAGEIIWLLWLGFIPAVLGGGILTLAKKIKTGQAALPGEHILSSLTALSPFVLILAILVQNPHGLSISLHWILGATLALSALNALAARIYKNADFLPAALAGATLVQIVYGCQRLSPQTDAAFACWTAGIFVLFFAFPFVFKKYFWESKPAWMAAALSGAAACGLIYFNLKTHTEGFHWGILPAAFLIIYLPAVKKLCARAEEVAKNPVPLAFMAGTALFFLTAIFPFELSGKWLTLAWTLEGAALIWLNTRVSYKGLLITGYGLLAVTALRLLLPDLAPIPATRVLNWYLGVYATYAACAFLAAKWWPEGGNPFWKKSLSAMGGTVLFWLLNIEIAHWFANGRLSFVFTGRLAEALAYTLAWALFGGACIGWGLFSNKPAASKAGAGVIILALVKFFLSDIWQLEALYRIIGLFGLAVILIGASFYYQKQKNIQ